MYTPYVRITTGNFQTTLDNTAQNPLGCIYAPPVNAGAITTAPGTGAQPVVKYVYYNSTSNPAVVASPAPVYYKDETFTVVTGNAAEAFVTTLGCMIAGYLLPNSTAYSGLTAAILNQSYCWIQIGGFLAGAYAPTTTPGAGDLVVGLTTGNWASEGVSAATANGLLGRQLTAVVSNACDVLVGADGTFWGS